MYLIIRSLLAAIPSRRILLILLVFAAGVSLCVSSCTHGFVTDSALRERFARNKDDYNELARLFASQKHDKIDANSTPRPEDDAQVTAIRQLLKRLGVSAISGTPKNTVIMVQIVDADLLRSRVYYFVHADDIPKDVVPSLYKAAPYKAGREPHMRLDDNWFATVYEDPDGTE